jgi:hypothetical protein
MSPSSKWNIWKTIDNILKGLPPEYKLIFGLLLVFFIFGIGSTIYSVIRNEAQALYLVFIGYIVAQVAAVIVIKKFNSDKLKNAEEKIKELESNNTLKDNAIKEFETKSKELPVTGKPLNVYLRFPITHEEAVGFNIERCELQITEKLPYNKEKTKPTVPITLMRTGELVSWYFQLTDIKPNYLAHLAIIDSDKQKWEVSHFSLDVPYETIRDVRRIKKTAEG